MEGCQFFTSASNAILCKEKVPEIAILKVRCEHSHLAMRRVH